MQCPRCNQKVALQIHQCPNCQQVLQPLNVSQQIPLSTQQRQALINKILLPSAGLLFIVAMLTSVSLALKPAPIWAWLAVAVMIAVTWVYLIKLVRDLISGQVLVEIDQLLQLHVLSDRTGKHFYGDFSTLGKRQLQASHFERVIEGNSYVVTYSPQSKIVWELVLVARKRA